MRIRILETFLDPDVGVGCTTQGIFLDCLLLSPYHPINIKSLRPDKFCFEKYFRILVVFLSRIRTPSTEKKSESKFRIQAFCWLRIRV
jgi:hypothetical protein